MERDTPGVLQRPLTLEQARNLCKASGYYINFRVLVDLEDIMAPYSVKDVNQMLCRQFLEGDYPDCLEEIEITPVAVVAKKLVLEVEAEFKTWLKQHDADCAAKADQPPAGGVAAGP